jgi:biopolymer transport protein ExbD
MARAPLLPPARRPPPADFALAIVNLVLLLVFFFMLTGSLVSREEVEVDLARTQDLPLDRLPRPLLLIDRAGNMALEGVAVPAEGLAGALEGAAVVNVLADAALPADRLFALVARPDLAGVAVRLVTLHERRALP